MRVLLLVAVLASSVLCNAAFAQANVKAILGWVETVELGPSRTNLEAKLDTGATTSSVHAVGIQRFRRRGTRFVRFQLPDGNGGFGEQLELPLERMVRIKVHGGDYERRPVVKLSVCLADFKRAVEFSLVDRSNFDQPVLLGRSALSGFVLVDPELVSTRDPACSPP